VEFQVPVQIAYVIIWASCSLSYYLYQTSC